MTEQTITEAQWNQAVDEWYAQQQKDLGIVTVPGFGTYPLETDTTYAGVTYQTHKVASEDLIRHYAFAIGDPNPLWQDAGYAKKTKYGTIIAPPTFECFIAATFTSRSFNPPSMGRLMSGVEHQYARVIRAGDEFRVFDRTHQCIEKTKPDKAYRLFLVRSERKYINQREEVACIAYGGAIAVGTPPGKGEVTQDQAYAGIKRRRFTEEELNAVYRAYDDELEGKKRRGSNILYWEDVVEGEELQPLAAGPLDVTDSVSFFHGVYNTYSFALKYHDQNASNATWNRRQPIIDPETNAGLSGAQIHLLDSTARLMRTPYAIAFGAQTEGVLAKLVTNWMGDDGFVKKLDCQMRRLWIFGHIVWAKGKVTRKYIENGEPLVDLDLIAENQDGLRIMPATATVRLYSREHPTKPLEVY